MLETDLQNNMRGTARAGDINKKGLIKASIEDGQDNQDRIVSAQDILNGA